MRTGESARQIGTGMELRREEYPPEEHRKKNDPLWLAEHTFP